jgi:hypothetical protein
MVTIVFVPSPGVLAQVESGREAFHLNPTPQRHPIFHSIVFQVGKLQQHALVSLQGKVHL